MQCENVFYLGEHCIRCTGNDAKLFYVSGSPINLCSDCQKIITGESDKSCTLNLSNNGKKIKKRKVNK